MSIYPLTKEILSSCHSVSPDSSNGHGRITKRTLKNRSHAYRDVAKGNIKNQLNQPQQFFCIAVEKTVVSDASEALWQDVLDQEKQKIFPFEGAVSRFSGFAFDVPEGNPTVFI